MAKRTKKPKKLKKSKKRKQQQWQHRGHHDDNCKLCDNYLCSTENVLTKAQQKRKEKEAIKDRDYKTYASTSNKYLDLNEYQTARRASLRPRKSVVAKKEEKEEVEEEKEPIIQEKEDEQESSTKYPIKILNTSTFPTTRWHTLNTLTHRNYSIGGPDIYQFLKQKPKGAPAKLEFLKPKLPLTSIKATPIKCEPDSYLSLSPTLNESTLINEIVQETREASSPINKYSYLLQNVKREVT